MPRVPAAPQRLQHAADVGDVYDAVESDRLEQLASEQLTLSHLLHEPTWHTTPLQYAIRKDVQITYLVGLLTKEIPPDVTRNQVVQTLREALATAAAMPPAVDQIGIIRRQNLDLLVMAVFKVNFLGCSTKQQSLEADLEAISKMPERFDFVRQFVNAQVCGKKVSLHHHDRVQFLVTHLAHEIHNVYRIPSVKRWPTVAPILKDWDYRVEREALLLTLIGRDEPVANVLKNAVDVILKQVRHVFSHRLDILRLADIIATSMDATRQLTQPASVQLPDYYFLPAAEGESAGPSSLARGEAVENSMQKLASDEALLFDPLNYVGELLMELKSLCDEDPLLCRSTIVSSSSLSAAASPAPTAAPLTSEPLLHRIDTPPPIPPAVADAIDNLPTNDDVRLR